MLLQVPTPLYTPRWRLYTWPSRAGVIQLVECELPKLDVAGSSPVSRFFELFAVMSNHFKSSQDNPVRTDSPLIELAKEPTLTKSARLLTCPLCGKAASDDKRYYPFCCARCKQIDLGNWAKESYRIDAGPLMDPGDPENESEE
jgi:endogenous inhibitor of DNA gyrase (YacG/DUF329 family)